MYKEEDYSRTGTMDNVSPAAVQNAFVNRVYGWMCAGLALTGLAAWYTAHSETLLRLLFQKGLMWVLIIATFVLVVGLSAKIRTISAEAASAMFAVYSVMEGMLFSSIFLVYNQSSVVTTFFAASLTFGVTSLAGWVTKRDLSGMGRLFFFALIGLVIGTLVNLFVGSSGFEMLLTYAGILIFAGLSAYDTQKIKLMSMNAGAMAREDGKKLAVFGALMLYLDFINLFLLLLRIFGGRRR